MWPFISSPVYPYIQVLCPFRSTTEFASTRSTKANSGYNDVLFFIRIACSSRSRDLFHCRVVPSSVVHALLPCGLIHAHFCALFYPLVTVPRYITGLHVVEPYCCHSTTLVRFKSDTNNVGYISWTVTAQHTSGCSKCAWAGKLLITLHGNLDSPNDKVVSCMDFVFHYVICHQWNKLCHWLYTYISA